MDTICNNSTFSNQSDIRNILNDLDWLVLCPPTTLSSDLFKNNSAFSKIQPQKHNNHESIKNFQIFSICVIFLLLLIIIIAFIFARCNKRFQYRLERISARLSRASNSKISENIQIGEQLSENPGKNIENQVEKGENQHVEELIIRNSKDDHPVINQAELQSSENPTKIFSNLVISVSNAM